MGIEVEALVEQRAVAAREDVDGSPELDEQVPVLGQARRECRRDVVGETGDDRDCWVTELQEPVVPPPGRAGR